MKASFIQPTKGFTLVEMAVVLVIVGLLLSGLLLPLSAQMDIRNFNDTKQRLAIINEAIYGFAILNGRLPCPTSQADPANINYGLEDCTITTEAYLPWKTLGVPATDAWGITRKAAADSWNGHWRYNVDNNFKDESLFSANILKEPEASTFSNDFLVRDSDGNQLTSTLTDGEKPIAIIYSTGKNLVRDGANQLTDDTYERNEASQNFDDDLIWIARPILINRLATANRLP